MNTRTESVGVYMIRNRITQRAYVGASANVVQRWSIHRTALRGGYHHNTHLQEDWVRYGEAAFEFVLVESVSSKDDLRAREQACLDDAAVTPYNMSPNAGPGNGPGVVFTEEHRRHIGDAKRGKPRPAQSLALTGRKLSPETREKMRAAHLGLKPTPEARAKCSASLTGRMFSAEHRAKISATKRNKPWSEKRRLTEDNKA